MLRNIHLVDLNKVISHLLRFRIVIYFILGILLLACGIYFASVEWFGVPALFLRLICN
jgi:hypothetical protein